MWGCGVSAVGTGPKPAAPLAIGTWSQCGVLFFLRQACQVLGAAVLPMGPHSCPRGDDSSPLLGGRLILRRPLHALVLFT